MTFALRTSVLRTSALRALLGLLCLSSTACERDAIVVAKSTAPSSEKSAANEEVTRRRHATPTVVPTERLPGFFRPDLAPPPSSPNRIVSLAPVVTEIVFDMGAQSALVGVTNYCDRPEAAKAIPKIGGFTSASFEKILERMPDLVIAMPSMGQRQILDRLVENKVPVLVAFGDTVSEIAASMEAIGTAVSSRQVARERLKNFTASLDDVVKLPTVAPLKAIVAVSASPIVLAGGNTFPNAALSMVGATVVVDESGPDWPTWSLEALAQSGANVVVAAEGRASAAKLRAGLLRMKVAIDVVSADRAILMRPGPHLADDVTTLSAILHRAKTSTNGSATNGSATNGSATTANSP